MLKIKIFWTLGVRLMSSSPFADFSPWKIFCVFFVFSDFLRRRGFWTYSVAKKWLCCCYCLLFVLQQRGVRLLRKRWWFSCCGWVVCCTSCQYSVVDVRMSKKRKFFFCSNRDREKASPIDREEGLVWLWKRREGSREKQSRNAFVEPFLPLVRSRLDSDNGGENAQLCSLNIATAELPTCSARFWTIHWFNVTCN